MLSITGPSFAPKPSLAPEEEARETLPALPSGKPPAGPLDGLAAAPGRPPSSASLVLSPRNLAAVSTLRALPASKGGELAIPMPQAERAGPPQLTSADKRRAVAATIAQQSATSLIVWGLVNKLPANLLTAALTEPIRDMYRNAGWEEGDAKALGDTTTQLVALAGHVVAAPLTGLAHRGVEAALTRLRKRADPDGTGAFAGVGFVPSHDFRNRKTITENNFVGAFGVGGGLKALIRGLMPQMGPWASFGVGTGLDMANSALAGGAAQALGILQNPQNKPMTYAPVTVAVPSDPAEPTRTRIADGEARNRGLAAFRTAVPAILCDSVKALLTEAPARGAPRAAARSAFNLTGSVLLGVLKGMAVLYAWFKGRDTEAGVRPSGRRAAESAARTATPAPAKASVAEAAREEVVGKAQSRDTSTPRMEGPHKTSVWINGESSKDAPPHTKAQP